MELRQSISKISGERVERIFNHQRAFRLPEFKEEHCLLMGGEQGDSFLQIWELIRFKKEEIDMWIENHREKTIDPDKKAKEILKGIKRLRWILML